VTLTVLSSLMSPVVAQVGDLARPATPWPADTTCLAADACFQADPERTSLLVCDDSGAIGLVSRDTLLLSLAGRYGFGRALLGKAAVSRVAQWDPTILPAEATVQDAAAALLRRDAGSRYEDLLVRWTRGHWGVLSAAGVLEALAGILAAQATSDSLTGLANRERLLAELAGSPSIAQQGVRPALIFIDLDRFKQVNDVYGHNVGDLVLIEIADRLRRVARPGDVIARLGGDEFVVKLALTSDHSLDPVRNAQVVA
jgi:GGDEF domain-containing protein